MVEAGGVEPPSERKTSQVSPSAVRDLNFALPAPADRLLRAIPDKFPHKAPRGERLKGTLTK